MIHDASAHHFQFHPTGNFTRGTLASHADMIRHGDEIKAGDWTITMSSDRTELSLSSTLPAAPTYKLKVGPSGVETTCISASTMTVGDTVTHFDEGVIADEVALKPSQYEFAGLGVASALIGLPVVFLAAAPQA